MFDVPGFMCHRDRDKLIKGEDGKKKQAHADVYRSCENKQWCHEWRDLFSLSAAKWGT